MVLIHAKHFMAVGYQTYGNSRGQRAVGTTVMFHYRTITKTGWATVVQALSALAKEGGMLGIHQNERRTLHLHPRGRTEAVPRVVARAAQFTTTTTSRSASPGARAGAAPRRRWPPS